MKSDQGQPKSKEKSLNRVGCKVENGDGRVSIGKLKSDANLLISQISSKNHNTKKGK